MSSPKRSKGSRWFDSSLCRNNYNIQERHAILMEIQNIDDITMSMEVGPAVGIVADLMSHIWYPVESI